MVNRQWNSSRRHTGAGLRSGTSSSGRMGVRGSIDPVASGGGAQAYGCGERVADIAASIQFNLARGMTTMAVLAAEERGIPRVVLSGGVAYNRAIRETIGAGVMAAGLEFIVSREYPLGDGCISFGQVVYGGSMRE